MKKVTRYIAEDGTQFEDEWECEWYEERLRIKEVFKPFSCYDGDGWLLDTDSENFNPDSVCYILVKESNYENGSYMDLDCFIFDGHLPTLCDTFKNVDTTVIYLNRNSDTWENWYEEFNKLTEIKETFQLFAGKGE